MQLNKTQIQRRPVLRAFTLALLLAVAVVATVWGQTSPPNGLEPRVPHDKDRAPLLNSDGLSARIVVKFHEGTGVRVKSGALELEKGYPMITNPYVPRLSRQQILAEMILMGATAADLGYRLAPMVDDTSERLAFSKSTAEAYWDREVADLRLYVQMVLSDWGRRQDLEALVKTLNSLESVEIAYAEPLAFPLGIDRLAPPPPAGPQSCGPGDVMVSAPNLEGDQGYIHAAPTGIDAFAAWTEPGGDGSGIRIIDVEAGYYEHADAPPLLSMVGHQGDCSGGQWNDACRDHGRMVAGILKSKDNGEGTTGIAHGAQLGVRSIINTNVHPDGSYGTAIQDSFLVANNIYWAGMHSIQGVVLLELHRNYGGMPAVDCPCQGGPPCSNISGPVEFWPAEFDAIQQAVGNGAVVIEAAGNGGVNLDDAAFGGFFEPGGPDSGAVMVTGSSSAQRIPMCNTGSPNTGTRVDLHAWGENVVTTGWSTSGHRIYDDGWCNTYVDHFSGSSSASAIVAGAAASLQGAVLAATGAKLDPAAVLSVLASTGTPQDVAASPPGAGPIGPQPNLAAALAAVLP